MPASRPSSHSMFEDVVAAGISGQVNFLVLIPAYQPTADFRSFIQELVARGVPHIVVVDDGSGPKYRSRFDEIEALPQVRLCRHAINLGKGAALKTGINTILCEYGHAGIVVTADADGQHHPDDVVAVGRFGEAHPGALVLGVRSFAGDVPFRSRFGNAVTRSVLRVMVGQKLTDTQTGLRAIPHHLLPMLLKIGPQGYDFELDVLLRCREQRVPILEVPIRTIYADGNATSHFNPLFDSMRIYFVLFRFASVSLCTAGLDNLLFTAVYASTSSLITSQICARLVSMLFNFLIVKKVVFKSQGRQLQQLLGYVALVAVSGTVSFGLIRMFVTHFGFAILPAKLCAESILFLANFLIQRDVIFSRGNKPIQAEGQPDVKAAALPALRVRPRQN